MTDEINPDEGLSASTRLIYRTRFLIHQQAREIRLEQLSREIANIRSHEFTNNSASPDIAEAREMRRRISMILAELAELRDGLRRVQEEAQQALEEMKQLENLVDYFGDRRFYHLLWDNESQVSVRHIAAEYALRLNYKGNSSKTRQSPLRFSRC